MLGDTNNEIKSPIQISWFSASPVKGAEVRRDVKYLRNCTHCTFSSRI